MRFARIDLDKYGHLTGVSMDLPARSPDLHILVGGNEVGKSTTQAALTDLLYGFQHKSDYAFLHDMRDLRVGGRIDNGKSVLDIWRLKARNNSLQEKNGNPLDDSALDVFLARVDRDTFLQQFSLNHIRLRTGGEAIVDAGNDLGRMLFQASAGLDWLGRRLHQMEEQSAGLFKPAGSKQTLAKALKQRDEALKRKREATASARAFKEVQMAEQQAQEDLNVQITKREEAAAQRTKLERARRVIPILRKIDRSDDDLASLGHAPSLPADVRKTFEEAFKAHEDAQRNVKTAKGELENAEKVRDAVTVDEKVLERAEEIEFILGTLKSRYQTAEEDLPKRREDLRGCEGTILNRSREVGRPDMTPKSVADHLPTRQQVNALRRLASEQKHHIQKVKSADEAVEKVRRDIKNTKSAVDDLGPTPDIALLRAAIETASADPGLETRIKQVQGTASERRIDIAKRVSKLVPNLPEDVLRKMLPSTTFVAQVAKDLAELDKRLQEQRDERQKLERQRVDDLADLNRLVATGKAVSSEDLKSARDRRNLGWQLVRLRYVDGQIPDNSAEKTFSAEQTLADAFVTTINSADAVADARFDAAEISGQLAAKTADKDTLERKLVKLAERIEQDEAAREKLLNRWHAAWSDRNIVPDLPSAMAEWLRKLEEIEEIQIDLRDNVEPSLASERATEGRYRSALAAALAFLGSPEPGALEELHRVLKRAQDTKENIEAQEQERFSTTQKIKDLEVEEGGVAQALTNAQEEFAKWQSSWSSKMAKWSLPATTDPVDVDSVLDAWDAIRAAHDKISGDQGLQYRIKSMQDNQENFVRGLRDMLAKIAPDQKDQPVMQAAQELEKRLGNARKARTLKDSASEAVQSRSNNLSRAVEGQRAAEDSLKSILRQIGVESGEDAEPVLKRAEGRANAERTLADLREELQKAGNGLAETTLRGECDNIDFDSLDGQIGTLESEDGRVVDEVQRVGKNLGACKEALDTFMQASAAAANAAAEVELESSSALRAAERYIRLQTTITLIRHAISRYRKENEGPLLRRASGLFRDLTLHRYAALEIDHDSGDRPVLRARQANNGTSVPVEGLSDGTRDQLFLALRLAGIEELLAKGIALPFVADDLFVNFDDDRAAAGLKVLADLATRTQVLFFTHHQHLVNLAVRSIPDRFSKLQLAA